MARLNNETGSLDAVKDRTDKEGFDHVEDIRADTARRRGKDESRHEGEHGSPQVKTIMERILAPENLAAAWKQVKANKGAPGIDGMTVEAFPGFCREHWPRIRHAIEKGTYTPAPVRRVPEWVRRRVRLYYWKQWSRSEAETASRRQPAGRAKPGNQPRTHRRHLIKLGANPDEVKMASRSRKGYWRMSSNRIVQQAMTNQWLEEQGVPNIRTLWIKVALAALAPSGSLRLSVSLCSAHYGPKARV